MGIQGNLKTMALPDVLQWLTNARGTGVLHVRHRARGITKRIFFRDGTILSTASSDPREYLGQFLLSRGLISEEQLNMAMETQLQTKIMLGKILIMCGILEEEQLTKMLILKAEESLFDLFLWEEGEFHFEDQPAAEENLVPLSLDAMSLIMEGVRRQDEWVRIRKVFPSARVLPAKTDTRLKTDALKPGSLILRTYESVDGKRTVEELALHLHASEFEVCHILFRLYEKGIVRIEGEKGCPEEESRAVFNQRLLDEARRALDEGHYKEAMNLYAYARKARPEDPDIQEGLRIAREGFLEEYFTEVLPLGTHLVLSIPMDRLLNEDLTPHEGYLASRLTGDWDIEGVVKVSPLPRNEALEAIRRLHEKGLVAVKPPR